MSTTLRINGKAVSVAAEPDTPLLWVLRGDLQMTGTKFGCGMALCGACTVHANGNPIRSCVTPVSAVAGQDITTIEGLRGPEADALRSAGPWGQGFPEPMFDGRFDVLDWRVIGEKHLKFSLRLPGHAAPLNAIHFNGWHDQPPPSRIHAAYQLETDDWQNRRDIQLLIRHWQAAD